MLILDHLDHPAGRRRRRTDLRAYVDVVNAVTPEDPASVEQIRWAEATYPGGVRLLAEQDGRVVGGAVVGRVHMYAPDYERYWFSCLVLPAARRRGVGSALTAMSRRSLGRPARRVCCGNVQPSRRTASTSLRIADASRPIATRPSGSSSPGWKRPWPSHQRASTSRRWPIGPTSWRASAVAVETFPDMPASERPLEPGPLEEFRARDVDRPGIPRDAFMIALDAGSGEVVGYASLIFVPGSKAIVSTT